MHKTVLRRWCSTRDRIQKAFAGSCSKGMEWNNTLNRCVTTAQAAQIMNATASCASDDVECYKANAQSAFQEKVNKGEAPERKKDNQFMSTVGNALAVAGPLSIALAGSSAMKSTCSSASFWAMVAGSASFIIGDNLANMQHQKRLKKIRDEWGKIVNPEGANGDKDREREISIEAQSEAFEMLAKAEDSMVKAAKMKKTFYTIAALAFTASGVISGLEIIAENADTTQATRLANTCKSAPAGSPAPSTPAPAAPSGAQWVKIRGSESLFHYYSKSSQPYILEHKYYYNLKNSPDMAAFVINKRASESNHSSPSLDEYQKLKEAYSNTIAEDSSVFETFKEFSLIVYNNLTIQSAIAEESTTNETTTNKNGSGNVQTNAAKAYKEDKGQGINFGGLLLGAAAGAAIGMLGSKLITPVTRTIFAGVMAGWSFIMASHAGSQAEASQKRADLLRKMKSEFASAAGAIYACKSEDRMDPSKPNCFCYTSENKRNPNRNNSPTCQKLWAGKNIAATNYLSGKEGNSKICINNQRKADPTCACKQTKSCLKVQVNGLAGINPGSFSMLSSSLEPMNKVADGSLDAANINTAALENQAARLRKLGQKVENSKQLANVKKNRAKAEAAYKKDLEKLSAKYPSSNFLGQSNSSSMPSNPGEAAKMLEKELDQKYEPTSIGNSGNTITAPTNEKIPDLEFGLSEDQAALQEGQIAEVMQQDLDYGGNDINQGSTANIFEVLSSRYQRSGMRRLFDEKGTTQADKPAESDITQ